MDRAVTVSLMLALLAACAGARAQVADPTAPPPGLAGMAAGEAAAQVPSGPVLQSILLSREPGGRRIAVISGEMVRQGGRWQGAVVEQVGDDRVVRRRGKARSVLRLQAEAATPAAPVPAQWPAQSSDLDGSVGLYALQLHNSKSRLYK